MPAMTYMQTLVKGDTMMTRPLHTTRQSGMTGPRGIESQTSPLSLRSHKNQLISDAVRRKVDVWMFQRCEFEPRTQHAQRP